MRAAASRTGEPVASGAGRRLLSVDDNLEIGALIGRVARRLGFATTVTNTAREFQAAFEREPPDVVVLDIFMPDMDGIELVRWIIQRRVDLQIIILSGNDPLFADAAILMAEARGVDRVDYLAKPVDVETLASILAA